MPPTLHLHLKRGLDFDDFHVHPEDVVEELPAEYRDPEQQAAKRRRIEAIASQYLRGRPPVILTAGLRGPFNDGWKNPWAKHTREKRRISDKSNGTADSRGGRSKVTATQKDIAANGSTTEVGGRKEDEIMDDIPAPRIASPETSRAAVDDMDIHEQNYSLNDIEVPPATAPLLDEDDVSGTAELFSMNTERYIQNWSSLTNPFWLRRPNSARVDMRKATNGNTDVSPTRVRSRNRQSQSEMQAGLRLSLPKARIQAHSPPKQAVMQEEWRSSASASMVISSPVKDVNSAGDGMNAIGVAEEQSLTRPNDIQTPKTATTPNTPHGTELGPCAQRIIPVIASSTGSQSRPPRDVVQRSAERLVNLMPTSSTSNKQPRRPSRKGTPNGSIPVASRHNSVASPGPASSNGFVYKKMEEPKGQGRNGNRPRPRAVDFNSSPALKKKPATVPERGPENMAAIQEAADVAPVQANVEPEEVAVEPPEQAEAEADVDADATVIQEENQGLRESRSSRTSDWSTQAAMVRAQLEFQQSTFPTISPGVGHLWSQPPQERPQPILTVPDPAITPMSVFNAQQDKTYLDGSVLRGPPISTQDLFGAASPFAFSTAKKKPEGPQRSTLRFSFLPGDGVDPMLNDATTKSPTPSADRIPLKDKNTTTSFWSFVTEKASQGSQKSLGNRSRRSVNDIELPQLDFHASLDDFGPNGDLHFTDRFLRHINDS